MPAMLALMLDDERIVLVLNPRDDQLCVTSVMRLETCDNRAARLRVYAMCPHTIREVADLLVRPCAAMGMYHLPREILKRPNEPTKGSGPNYEDAANASGNPYNSSFA
jgi:hypothetical protein